MITAPPKKNVQFVNVDLDFVLNSLAVNQMVNRVPGKICYVSSVDGHTSNDGYTRTAPKATLTQGISQVDANQGDVVVCLPSHAETVDAAADIDINKAGISVIGWGDGDNKPTLTFSTLTTATLKFSSKNCTLDNFRFVGNIDSLVKFVDVSNHYCTILNCDFVTSSTKEALSFINLATTFDYLRVKGCRFEQPTDPAGTDGAADTGAIFMVDSEYVFIEDCHFAGNFETAIIHNRTTAAKHLWIKNCTGIQALSGAEPVQLVDGCTGAITGLSAFITPAEAAATEATLLGTVGAAFFVLQPCSFGNDSGAGGSGGIIIATAS